jgi:hypothetical protein
LLSLKSTIQKTADPLMIAASFHRSFPCLKRRQIAAASLKKNFNLANDLPAVIPSPNGPKPSDRRFFGFCRLSRRSGASSRPASGRLSLRRIELHGRG